MRIRVPNIVFGSIALVLGSCTQLVFPAVEPAEPAAQTARVEEARRVHALAARQDQAQAIARYVPELVRGVPNHDVARVSPWIVEVGHRTGLDPLLIAAVITIESYYRPAVVSEAGAVGLMQVLPYVGADVAQRHDVPWDGWQTLTDPARNIAIGATYLSELVAAFDGDVSLALAAYNMGPTLLRSRLRRGWRPQGPYVAGVMRVYRQLVARAQASTHLRERTVAMGVGLSPQG